MTRRGTWSTVKELKPVAAVAAIVGLAWLASPGLDSHPVAQPLRAAENWAEGLHSAVVKPVLASARDGSSPLRVTAVDSVGFTVSDMDRAVVFYTEVLPFTKISDQEVSGRPYELLSGLFGARARVVKLRLRDETIELTEFLTPKGRPIPPDIRANDRQFQHIAIVVTDIQKAYGLLRARNVEHASTGPQRLPDWNPNAGGISAFYFRDPDRHFLEIISFPEGKGAPRWQTSTRDLFLGIDHTAIVVDDTRVSLTFYRDTLGMRVAGESENYDAEQEHLNNVFGARLRITALRAGAGPGLELLEYLAPRDGRPAPTDLRANDVGHWQTSLVIEQFDPLIGLARDHRVSLVSPGSIDATTLPLGFRSGSLARDPDGHGMRLIVR
jgi:catechol 2,3-dioxygenase-like lactoylglutathione lyase family enzyme